MSQPSLINKWTRVLRTLKYPLVIAIIAGIVWYIRSQPIPVASHTVSTGPVVRSVMGTGTLEARIRTTISPKIQGRIAEVLVDQGSVVNAGQLLVRLDDEDLAQQVPWGQKTHPCILAFKKLSLQQSPNRPSDLVRCENRLCNVCAAVITDSISIAN